MKNTSMFVPLGDNLNKFLQVMKCILLFLIIEMGISVSANSYSQSKLFSFHISQISIRSAIMEIEQNSDFIFFYKDRDVDLEHKSSLNVKESSITEVLEQLLKGTDNSYVINDRQIYITKKNEEPVGKQGELRKITGKVVDEENLPLSGATILIDKSTRGVSADLDGSFSIDVREKDKLVVSFIGMESQIIEPGKGNTLIVILKPKANVLQDVTVVAFGKQKKESVIGSIEAINPKDLKVPSSNFTSSFSGRVAGMISYQASGEPGDDLAKFFIRGVTSFGYSQSPLILLDNFEISNSELSRIEPDNIASFSIMKDATATALYGARGANGVILITTKEGEEGKVKVSFRHESSFSAPTRLNKVADGLSYMRLYNEAQYNDDPTKAPFYDAQKIENTRLNLDPYAYPNINWYDELFKDYTYNHRYNLNINGGGKTARYYLSASYNKDNGILNVDKRNNFNNNISIDRFDIRTNINLNLTKTTEIAFKMNGQFERYNGPAKSGNDIFNSVINSNPVSFPKYYLPTEGTTYVNHILFGNTLDGSANNPYAQMVSGYKDSFTSTILAQLQLNQDLGFITKGLNARANASIRSYGSYSSSRSYSPYYYGLKSYDEISGKLELENLIKGTETLGNPSTIKNSTNRLYFEIALQYNRKFLQKHDVGGLLVYTMQEELNTTPGNSIFQTLPSRNLGLAGRFSYGYDDRYLTELNFGYNGSERFSKHNRFGFFPSFGLGYVVSNEDFWGTTISTVIPKLKFKYTYGLVGNDNISSRDERFFFLSEINDNYAGNGYRWGTDFNTSYNGFWLNRYANPKITWEISYKQNLGIEMNLLSFANITVDFFKEKRENIYMTRKDLPKTMGLTTAIAGNVGKVDAKGIDGSLDLNHVFNNDFWISGRFNFTYSTNKVVYKEEPVYKVPYRYSKGHPVDQQWGYVAERLFIDNKDVLNSPKQNFGGNVQAGDIKYKDINDDGMINENDQVAIGFPTVPEVMYGVGPSIGFKGFDFSFFLQGSARSSFFINPATITPFTKGNNILEIVANDHWTPDNGDIHAFWPRLSIAESNNNIQRSTWWMRNGGYLRVKSVELGYSFPSRIMKKMHLKSLRLYASGTNLFVFSKFKMWDPEMGSNGLAYPLQRIFNMGLQLSF